MKRWLLLAVVVLGVGGVAWYASQNSSSDNVDETVKNLVGHPVTVTYKVEGTASTTDITYEGPTGTSQQSGVDVPLKKKSDSTEGITVQLQSGAHAYLSAQNGGDSGDITCIIEENGRELTRNTSRGGFTIATCQAVA